MTRITVPLLSVMLFAVVACTEDHGDPPVIANLTASPLTVPVGAATTISGTLTFTDRDGDLDLIAVTVVTPDDSRVDLAPAPIQIPGGLTEGQLTWAVILQPPAAGRYDLELSVIDEADNDSNTLTTSLTAQ